ncbi:hypothetical protein PybrP1_012503 [[Pythium] brassicae (nom. inval.)]|nr:hypothetical protein PybrP1_012503 [[Pythium] brassicae (nom. inval.)]
MKLHTLAFSNVATLECIPHWEKTLAKRCHRLTWLQYETIYFWHARKRECVKLETSFFDMSTHSASRDAHESGNAGSAALPTGASAQTQSSPPPATTSLGLRCRPPHCLNSACSPCDCTAASSTSDQQYTQRRSPDAAQTGGSAAPLVALKLAHVRNSDAGNNERRLGCCDCVRISE